jgi:hypothetical protein
MSARSRSRPWWRTQEPSIHGACLEGGACLRRAHHQYVEFSAREMWFAWTFHRSLPESPHTTAEDWARALIVDPSAMPIGAFDEPVEVFVCQTIITHLRDCDGNPCECGADPNRYCSFDFGRYNGLKP